jgi:hypothetical protein
MSCLQYTPWREKSDILKIDECYDYIYTPQLCGCIKSAYYHLLCPWRGYGWKEVSECTDDWELVDENNTDNTSAI